MSGYKDKRDLNRSQRTSLANSGRAAGSGIVCDYYGEGDDKDYINPRYCPQGLPMYSKAEWEEMIKEQPVKRYKIGKDEAKGK